MCAAGILATFAVAFLPLPIRVPGHAILKATLPIVVGVSLAPRLYAGTLAGLSAGISTGALLLLGIGHLQTAAVAALLAIGPALDLALRTAERGGWSLYLRMAFAGLAANLLAFVVRWGIAWLGVDSVGPHMLKHIGWGTGLSFALCGVLAGLVSAAICFRGSTLSE